MCCRSWRDGWRRPILKVRTFSVFFDPLYWPPHLALPAYSSLSHSPSPIHLACFKLRRWDSFRSNELWVRQPLGHTPVAAALCVQVSPHTGSFSGECSEDKDTYLMILEADWALETLFGGLAAVSPDWPLTFSLTCNLSTLPHLWISKGSSAVEQEIRPLAGTKVASQCGCCLISILYPEYVHGHRILGTGSGCKIRIHLSLL